MPAVHDMSFGAMPVGAEISAEERPVATIINFLVDTRPKVDALIRRLGFVLSPDCETVTNSVESFDSEQSMWELKNQRRIYLIEREFEDGLNEVQEAELERLQEEVFTELDEKIPLPMPPQQ